MAKRVRTERRAAERAAAKLARSSEKLARLEAGGAPERPIDVSTASVVEPHARSAACAQCAREGTLRVESHEARIVAGERLRVVSVSCSACSARRDLYFRIALPS